MGSRSRRKGADGERELTAMRLADWMALYGCQ